MWAALCHLNCVHSFLLGRLFDLQHDGHDFDRTEIFQRDIMRGMYKLKSNAKHQRCVEFLYMQTHRIRCVSCVKKSICIRIAGLSNNKTSLVFGSNKNSRKPNNWMRCDGCFFLRRRNWPNTCPNVPNVLCIQICVLQHRHHSEWVVPKVDARA